MAKNGKDFYGPSAFGVIRHRNVLPLVILCFSAIVTFFLAACGGQASSPAGSTPASTVPAIPAITIKAMDFSFDQPKSLPAGLVDVTLFNNGKSEHQLQIVRINDGVSYDQFYTALKDSFQKNDLKVFSMVTFFGGANALKPGQSQEVILNLTQGNYVAVCVISGADNVPHFMKGMITQFTVSGAATTQVQPPKEDGTILLKDFSFVLPQSLPSGPVTLKVTNQGPQAHEMDIVKLTQGKTIEDLKKLLNSPSASQEGPPPSWIEDAGGMAGLQLGSSAWIKLNLQPGNYAALCFFPDPKTGQPHFMKGMIGSFKVQ